jgi:uncharacterized membrane protein YvbJ
MNYWKNVNRLIEFCNDNLMSDEAEDITFYLKDWKRLKKKELKEELND